MTNESRSRLLEIIKEKSLRTGDEFTLTSGRKSTYFIDGKHTSLDPEGSALLAEAMLEATAGDEVVAIGGMTLGADPIVGATVCLSHLRGRPLKGFIVRKEAKGHGTMNQVEGTIDAGDRVIVVEDVTTTGGSALKAVEAVEAVGAEVARIVTMVDRLEGAVACYAERGYAFTAIFTIKDLGVEPGKE